MEGKGKLWRGFKAQLNATPWAADSFLAFFYPMCFHPQCQTQLVTDFWSAEWDTRRKKKPTKLCWMGGWKPGSSIQLWKPGKNTLVRWFNVLFRVLIPSQVSVYLRQRSAPEDRYFWCNSPLSLEKNPLSIPYISRGKNIWCDCVWKIHKPERVWSLLRFF